MKEIIDQIIKFRDQREWSQFHNIKDLLIGLNMEVAELQELFLWKSAEEEFHVDVVGISNELADIFIFLAYIANKYEIDLDEAVKSKLKIHSDHYPVNLAKNKTKKYTEFKDGKDN